MLQGFKKQPLKMCCPYATVITLSTTYIIKPFYNCGPADSLGCLTFKTLGKALWQLEGKAQDPSEVFPQA